MSNRRGAPSGSPPFNAPGFYAALDSERSSRGLQWKQVAEQAGVSASTLTRLAQGKRPDVDGFAALTSWSGLDANDFLKRGIVPDPKAQIIATLFRADPNLSDAQKTALSDLIVSAYKLVKREQE